MNKSDAIDKYKEEQEFGRKASLAYNSFIAPFIASKRKILFDNFCNISIANTEALLETKRLITVIDDLETEIMTVIETGKLASQSLEDV
jgi:hypothetical protein